MPDNELNNAELLIAIQNDAIAFMSEAKRWMRHHRFSSRSTNFKLERAFALIRDSDNLLTSQNRENLRDGLVYLDSMIEGYRAILIDQIETVEGDIKIKIKRKSIEVQLDSMYAYGEPLTWAYITEIDFFVSDRNDDRRYTNVKFGPTWREWPTDGLDSVRDAMLLIGIDSVLHKHHEQIKKSLEDVNIEAEIREVQANVATS